MRIVIGVIVGCTLAACASSRPGGHGDDDGGSGTPLPVTATLAISPAASELVMGIGETAQGTYTATLTYRDGTVKDVTAQTLFSIDGSYGKFTANVVAIGTAVRTKVFAQYIDPSVNATASGDVVVRVKSVRVVAPLPADTTAGLFASDGVLSFAPQIKYPPVGTVMPRNLGDFEIHWADTNGNNVFELSLSDKNPGDPHDDSLTNVRVYVPGDNQATGVSYAAFTPAEWEAARGYKNAVTYQVRGVNTARPGVVGAAVPQTVQLSNEKMNGGLYYWATASDSNVIGIFRHDMNKPGQRAEEYITTNPSAGGRCVGCHVLSRDGTRMAITYEDPPNPGPATMVDVATVGIQPQTQRWNFGTFTPDGTQFLSVDHGVLVARDAATQAILATMTTTSSSKWVTQPDVTSGGDGKPLKLVYVIPALFGTDFSFKLGQIYTRTYDQATHVFGTEQLLLADGQNNFFPSWSPDGNWIAFNKCDTNNTSYDNKTSSTWVMKADGTQQRPLAMANQAADVTNSAVRWAPFQLSFGPDKEPMFWLTMSSKRDFGVRMTNTGLAQTVKRAQIWMTPFFPARATAQQDPSTPAFRLPFQNLDSSNQTAQWTERVVDVIL
jgi:hypothetical protein